MDILLNAAAARIHFRVNDDLSVDLADFSALPDSAPMPRLEGNHDAPVRTRPFLSVHVTGENAGGFHAGKHDCGSVVNEWRYVDHRVEKTPEGEKLTLSVRAANGLTADYTLQTYDGISIVRAQATITNASDAPIGLEFASSFIYAGIGKNRASASYDAIEFDVPRNNWCNEARWQMLNAVDVNLSHMPSLGYNLPEKGNGRFHYGSGDSWSSSEYLPMGIARDPESGEVWFFQIEHSGAWTAEYGMADGRNLYLCLLGPNDESDWWKELKPGESFTTVPVAFGTAIGGIDEAVGELTRYRRRIRRPNDDDARCNVVFNDYMNCLFADPTEEKEKIIIDRAAALGCEYYCLDAGWYDSGYWWDRVGEWRECAERFPNGLKAVYDYARGKGLKMGMWLEIESMGTECPLAKQLPDDWFVCTHGRRRVENHRYLLDFRNPDVRAYCTGVVDRLIEDYGCAFFKIDYNVTTGRGSDLNADSRGDAMLEHYRALYGWICEIYGKYPELVIENCGSGGQRMDYGMLSLHSLQSTSDQTDYRSNAYIAANVAAAVAPEQAGMWVYPYVDDREHVVFNMVCGLLLRPYVSGIVWEMSDASMAMMKAGIDCYKAIRGRLTQMTPFFPLGFCRVNDRQLAYGLKDERGAYLSVFAIGGDTAEIPLDGLKRKIAGVRVIYPQSEDCEYRLDGGVLKVKFPQIDCARLFELTFE